MSIKLMTKVWEKEVSHSELAILLAMADYADDEGRNCYPSYDRLAWKTGYSARQVQRIIKDLCEKGILVITKPATQHQSAHYWIRLDRAKNKAPFRVDKMSSLDESRVDKCDTQGRQMEHARVDTMSTDPLVNHQEKRESAPLPVHHTLPGVSVPRWRQEKRDADRIARERDAMGLNAKELTALTDRVLARMNALELANSDTDFGDEEFTQAQQTTLALARLGHKTNDAIDGVFDCWPTVDWRGKKGEPPTYKGIVEHAKALGMSQTVSVPTNNKPQTLQRMEGEEW